MFVTSGAEALFDNIAPYMVHQCWCMYMLGMGKGYNLQATEENIKSLENGIVVFKQSPNITPEQMHNNWVKFKLANGWVYGLAKDVDAKIHPDLRPYNELPMEERNKDKMTLETLRFCVWLANGMEENAEKYEKS